MGKNLQEIIGLVNKTPYYIELINQSGEEIRSWTESEKPTEIKKEYESIPPTGREIPNKVSRSKKIVNLPPEDERSDNVGYIVTPLVAKYLREDGHGNTLFVPSDIVDVVRLSELYLKDAGDLIQCRSFELVTDTY